MKPLASIITPVYNAAEYLEETVKSVQAQTCKNWELILVDDGSIDNSLAIAQSLAKTDKRIKVISLKNSGAAIARNTGINLAEGNYICFIDSDDLWLPEKLEKQLSFMQSKNCAFSFTGYEFADESGKPNGKKVNVPASISYKQSLKNTIIWTSTVMLNMNLLSKDSIAMPNLRKGQDTATWWKILKQIDKAYGMDVVTAYYRRHSNTLSSNKFKALKRTWNLYRNVEHLDIFASAYNFSWYCFHAIKRRV